MIIDFHAHVFPNRFLRLLESQFPAEKIQLFRRIGRIWLGPASQSLHKAQVFMRNLPEPLRAGLDQVGGLLPFPRLLLESTPEDLVDAMDEAGVDRALVLAHPPACPNELVLELGQENDRVVPVVNLPPSIYRPGATLTEFIKKGARGLKIHPAADGEGPESPHYKALLAAAADEGIPVILHTGCIHNHVFYKKPELGHAEKFEPWFQEFSKVKFILAHMNFHSPQIALDLAERNSNVWVDTSWQPTEIIGEAVRRIGAERVLFGSDWPLLGENMTIGIERIRQAVQAGTVQAEDEARILGGNAAKLLGLEESDGSST